MQPPCELMTNHFLPNMRGLVSHDLHDAGESQRRIAVLLGITQARVSYYLGRRKTTFTNELTNRFAINQNDILSYSKILSEDVRRSQVDGIFTLYSIWKNLLFSGAICSAHQRESNIQSDCSVCMELHKPARESASSTDEEAEDSAIIREISKAVTLIESSTRFPYLMPEVSVNIAMSRKHPKTSRDIAAIPGRLNRIHGRAKAFVMPEFGCSNHMSKVLLIFHARNQNFRAVLNLKYDDAIEKALDEFSIPKFFTDHSRTQADKKRPVGSAQQDILLARLESTKLLISGEARTVTVIDRGSEGVEPITYLLGTNATEITELAIKMSRAYATQLSGGS
ncbi:MAG: hypothetical protein M1587_02490 [Thaumarchaeota archaeon]|nr:hypothetical protein [Nitrososphaerota archaeon]